MAYTRLLRLYYRTEKPIPADLTEACRLVRARSKDERKAVESILREFFALEADGWRNKRADVEIAKFGEGAAEREEKAKHEAERMRRLRGRRSELFAALRELGIVPKWDTGLQELQRLLKQASNGPVTDQQREQVPNSNAPVTRTGAEQVPNNNGPETAIQNQNQNHKDKNNSAQKALVLKPAEIPEPVWNDFIALRKAKKAPLTDTALQGIRNQASIAKITLESALRMCCERGWQGFKADWINGASAGVLGGKHDALLRRNADAMEEFLRQPEGGK